jgi:thymidylate kinase
MNKNNRLTYIIYEGPDCVGKTTTRKLVEKHRDGKDIVLDRFIGSNIVFGSINHRYTLEEMQSLWFDDYLFVARFNPALVYLYAPVDTLIERIKNTKHEDIDKEKLEKTLIEFDKYFDRSDHKNKIKINTSIYNQEEVVRQIINFLENAETK